MKMSMAWINNYIPLFGVDVITYPSPNFSLYLLVKWAPWGVILKKIYFRCIWCLITRVSWFITPLSCLRITNYCKDKIVSLRCTFFPTCPVFTHLLLVPHICVRALGQHWFRSWHGAWSAPSHYLNQCWNIVNCTLRKKNQWNLNKNYFTFIQENALENIVCEIGGHFVSASMC